MTIDTATQPDGWAETTLDALIEPLQTGSRPIGGVRHIAAGIPSLGGEHLNERGGFRFENIKYVPHSFYERMTRGQIQTGDILIVKDGATTGKVSLVRADFPHRLAVVNEHVFICRPLSDVYPPFLFYFLFSEEGQRRILENFKGSAQGGINRGFALGTTVPLAPYAEQKRIAAQVETLLERAYASWEKLNRASTLLKQFRQSILTAACSGRLTMDWREQHSDLEPASSLLERVRNARRMKLGSKYKEPGLPYSSELPEVPDGWGWTTLLELAELKSGITKGQKYKDGVARRTIPYLRVANVQKGFLDLTEIKTIEASEVEIDELRLMPNDILFNEGGDRDKLGRGWIWEGQIAECIHQNHVFRARLYFSGMQSRFLSWYGNSIGAQYFIDKGTQTVNLASISITRLGALPVPLPTLDEQAEIVRRVEMLSRLADVIEKRLVAAIQRAEKAVQAILTQAFRGELVATEAELARQEGRNYEAAVTLLERIRDAKAATVQQEKARIVRVPADRRTKIVAKTLQEITPTHLTDTLRARGGRLSPEDLWRLAELTMDDFYTQLKREMETIRDVRLDEQTRFLEATS